MNIIVNISEAKLQILSKLFSYQNNLRDPDVIAFYFANTECFTILFSSQRYIALKCSVFTFA